MQSLPHSFFCSELEQDFLQFTSQVLLLQELLFEEHEALFEQLDEQFTEEHDVKNITLITKIEIKSLFILFLLLIYFDALQGFTTSPEAVLQHD